MMGRLREETSNLTGILDSQMWFLSVTFIASGPSSTPGPHDLNLTREFQQWYLAAPPILIPEKTVLHSLALHTLFLFLTAITIHGQCYKKLPEVVPTEEVWTEVLTAVYIRTNRGCIGGSDGNDPNLLTSSLRRIPSAVYIFRK